MSNWLKAALVAIGILLAAAAALVMVPVDDDATAPATNIAETSPALESATPATATAPAAVASLFYDDWVSADGKIFNIDTEEDTGNLYVFAGSRIDDGTGGGEDTPPPNAPGQDLYGNGSIEGRLLTVTLIDLYSNENHALQLEISEDGTTLTGSITRGEGSETRQLSLRRK